ncbi:MAG: hypothetical protein LIO90_07440 [Bacteroidales bacterium]|nr:hypothetical protein [Bacteroidales bacterium]
MNTNPIQDDATQLANESHKNEKPRVEVKTPEAATTKKLDLEAMAAEVQNQSQPPLPPGLPPIATPSKKVKGALWRKVKIGGIVGLVFGGTAAALRALSSDDQPALIDEGAFDEYFDDELLDDEAIVNDDMTFSEAFAAAREELGPGGVFQWHGGAYATYTADEWAALHEELQIEDEPMAEAAMTVEATLADETEGEAEEEAVDDDEAGVFQAATVGAAEAETEEEEADNEVEAVAEDAPEAEVVEAQLDEPVATVVAQPLDPIAMPDVAPTLDLPPLDVDPSIVTGQIEAVAPSFDPTIEPEPERIHLPGSLEINDDFFVEGDDTDYLVEE